jgi:hypothetical protein
MKDLDEFRTTAGLYLTSEEPSLSKRTIPMRVHPMEKTILTKTEAEGLEIRYPNRK